MFFQLVASWEFPLPNGGRLVALQALLHQVAHQAVRQALQVRAHQAVLQVRALLAHRAAHQVQAHRAVLLAHQAVRQVQVLRKIMKTMTTGPIGCLFDKKKNMPFCSKDEGAFIF